MMSSLENFHARPLSGSVGPHAASIEPTLACAWDVGGPGGVVIGAGCARRATHVTVHARTVSAVDCNTCTRSGQTWQIDWG
jgi:hypothetical protein